MRGAIALLLFIGCAFAEVPTDKDALRLKDAQIRVMQARAALDEIMADPVVVKARAVLIAAQEALKAEQDRHPGCTLKPDNSWQCGEKKQEP